MRLAHLAAYTARVFTRRLVGHGGHHVIPEVHRFVDRLAYFITHLHILRFGALKSMNELRAYIEGHIDLGQRLLDLRHFVLDE